MADKTPLHKLDQPLSNADLTTYASALSQLQGNILKSHGRAAAVYLFLTFHESAQREIKRFLSSLARKKLTSAAVQREDTQGFRSTNRSELFTALYLSATGYDLLGLSLEGFSPEFRNGMRAAKLDDPPLSDWEPNFQKDLHAMVLYAHDKVEELTKQLDLLKAAVAGYAEVSCELGISMQNGAGQVIEHFGYVDGISQPLFYESDLKVKGLTTKTWDPRAGPSLVLVPDPHGKSDEACGTYVVFRKLEQNVKAFRTKTQELAAALQLGSNGQELAGAMVIGRFPDGTPVALYGQAIKKKLPDNDFRYSDVDPNGNRCPFAAHIRKANPRGDTVPPGGDPAEERRHRIARRGITYGDPLPAGNLNSLPETGVGLLFQCCQADLGQQFEFLQRNWANNDNSPKQGSGKDPVIGQSAGGAFPDIGFPNPWDSPQRKPFSFHGVVKMKGGEYFFAPSISFLEGLSY